MSVDNPFKSEKKISQEHQVVGTIAVTKDPEFNAEIIDRYRNFEGTCVQSRSSVYNETPLEEKNKLYNLFSKDNLQFSVHVTRLREEVVQYAAKEFQNDKSEQIQVVQAINTIKKHLTQIEHTLNKVTEQWTQASQDWQHDIIALRGETILDDPKHLTLVHTFLTKLSQDMDLFNITNVKIILSIFDGLKTNNKYDVRVFFYIFSAMLAMINSEQTMYDAINRVKKALNKQGKCAKTRFLPLLIESQNNLETFFKQVYVSLKPWLEQPMNEISNFFILQSEEKPQYDFSIERVKKYEQYIQKKIEARKKSFIDQFEGIFSNIKNDTLRNFYMRLRLKQYADIFDKLILDSSVWFKESFEEAMTLNREYNTLSKQKSIPKNTLKTKYREIQNALRITIPMLTVQKHSIQKHVKRLLVEARIFVNFLCDIEKTLKPEQLNDEFLKKLDEFTGHAPRLSWEDQNAQDRKRRKELLAEKRIESSRIAAADLKTRMETELKNQSELKSTIDLQNIKTELLKSIGKLSSKHFDLLQSILTGNKQHNADDFCKMLSKLEPVFRVEATSSGYGYQLFLPKVVSDSIQTFHEPHGEPGKFLNITVINEFLKVFKTLQITAEQLVDSAPKHKSAAASV